MTTDHCRTPDTCWAHPNPLCLDADDRCGRCGTLLRTGLGAKSAACPLGCEVAG